jgi:two-component system, chemotaxis family, CheB/CheR fusion protein
VPGDIGRSIGFLNPFLGDGSLEPKAANVIQSLATHEEEVQASNQRWYQLRITPYKTLDHTIRGALVSLVDIDVRRRALELTRDVPAFADRFLAAVADALLIVDQNLRVIWVNDVFSSNFEVAPSQVVGLPLGMIAVRQFGEAALQNLVKGVFATATPVRNHEMKLGEQTVRFGVGILPGSVDAPLALISISKKGQIAELEQ